MAPIVSWVHLGPTWVHLGQVGSSWESQVGTSFPQKVSNEVQMEGLETPASDRVKMSGFMVMKEVVV